MSVRSNSMTTMLFTGGLRSLLCALALGVFLSVGTSGSVMAQDAVQPEVAADADLDAVADVAPTADEHAGEDHDGDDHGDNDHGDNGHGDTDHADHEMPPLLSINLGSAVWNLFIFLLTLLILGVFVWPQILAGLQAREDKIHADIAGAEKANAEAKAALATYQSQLAEAQTKIQEMMADARKNAERVGAEIVEQAKVDAERQRQRALADIEAAKAVAITELAGQTSDLAISLARQVVGRELNANDHAELIRQSLDRLPSQN